MTAKPSSLTRRVLAVALFLSGALAGACGSTETSGSNTNWLEACERDAECGAGARCVCRVCSASCTEDSACEAVPAAACVNAGAAFSVQCGTSSNEGVCLHGCVVATDCAAGTCVGGHCVQPVDSTGCEAHPEALVCSGFEEQDLGGWMTTAPPTGELSAVSGAFAGAHALQATTAGKDGRTRFVRELTPQTSGSLYLRVWLFVAPDAVLTDLHTLTIGDVDTADWGVDLAITNGALVIGTPAAGSTPLGDVPRGRWFCVRERIDVAATGGTVESFLDDAPAASLSNVATLPANGVHNVSVGLDYSGQNEPFRLLIDNLLVDSSPVGCAD